MYLCTHCHFDVDDDDAESKTEDGHCLCLRCFTKLRGEKPTAFGKFVLEDLAESIYAGDTGNSRTVTNDLPSDWPEGRTKADLDRFLKETGEGLQPA